MDKTEVCESEANANERGAFLKDGSHETAGGIVAQFRARVASFARRSDNPPPLEQVVPPKRAIQGSAEIELKEHLCNVQDVCSKFGTIVDLQKPSNSQGLSSLTVSEKTATFGSNEMTPPRRAPSYWKFLQCLGNLFNVLLVASGIGYLITYAVNSVDYFENAYIGCILMGIALLNAGIEFYELQKISAILNSFGTLIPLRTDAIRQGQKVSVLAKTLVPGDVVFVGPGSKVPADVYIFFAVDCKLDLSNLTGETEPVTRKAMLGGAPNGIDVMDAPNLAFNGTIVVGGEAYGIVIRTGDDTVMGKIAAASKSEKKRRSPLSAEIHSFIHTISLLASFTAFIFFIFAAARGRNFNYALTFGIGILVAWIPQGLAVTVTMLLTIAGRRMTENNVLVKDLHGVETLGALTLLATDKTGTLTANQMSVMMIFAGGRMWRSHLNTEEKSQDDPILKVSAIGIAQILHMSATCTRARFDRHDIPLDQRAALGDATECGLLRWSASKLLNFDKISELYPKIFEIPFTSENKFHLSIHRKAHQAGGLTLYAKGAPEVIWDRCSSVLCNQGQVPLQEEERRAIRKAHSRMCDEGFRVIAFAMVTLNGKQYPDNWKFDREKENYPTANFTFVGMTALEDPPKPGVRQAIGKIRNAGIKVLMVTGDHPLTAEAIARQVNIYTKEAPVKISSAENLPILAPSHTGKNSTLISGTVIPLLSDTDWLNILLHEEIVFARTSPTHKLDIVSRAQALGHIVGVTGDGVNDAPALKKADLGIAMNYSGSDISKEASGMVLLDDNFATITRGILEGRLIFWNLKKAIKYSLTHIMAEILPYLLFVLIPIPQCLTSIQILAVDLGFELFITLSFAFEPPDDEGALMRMPPRRPVTHDSILAVMTARRLRQDARMAAENGSGEQQAKPTSWMTNVMMWAYLEGGIIECCGALCTFFVILWSSFGITPGDAVMAQKKGKYFLPHSPPLKTGSGDELSGDLQFDALKQGRSGFYLAILLIQVWNLFACKARLRIPFGKFMVQNTKTWAAIFAGCSAGFLIVYTPFTNALFFTSMNLDPIYLLIPMVFGMFLFLYSAARRLVMQRVSPDAKVINVSGMNMESSHWSLHNPATEIA
ncbi:hypothetical protein DFS34DRAFT_643207 [Phlyctochytrium arcticum]|nr:hypothetical protein DFS34DRAFT_643207 [Phlyctochytrium arcticum]